MARRLSGKEVHAIADKMAPKVRAAFLAAVASLRSNVDITRLAAAIETGSVTAALNAIGINAFGERLNGFTNSLRDTYFQSALDKAAKMPGTLNIIGGFDMVNPTAVDFLRRYDLALITGITNETREGIRAVLLDSINNGIPPIPAASKIKEMIGLTPRLTQAVLNYEDMLDETTDFAPAKIGQMVERYADRLLGYRAKMISRTESLRAGAEGRREFTRQMIEQGYLDGSDVKRYWRIVDDDLVCENCLATEKANADGIGFNEMFWTPLGPVEGEPLHPSCRCVCVEEYS